MPDACVIFDLDGTLTVAHLDFDAIRAEIGLPPGPILESLALLEPRERRRAEQILSRHEMHAALCAQLQEGAVDVLTVLRARGFPVGILTRNARHIVELVLSRTGLEVDGFRAREDGLVKPSPTQFLSLCAAFSCAPASSWMVGDYLFDLQCGQAAGAQTVLLATHDRPVPDFADQADHVIRRLPELLRIVAR